ncbi:nucleoside phosphorylase domain-containing protein [Mycena floridula]|nr:nucleoside phosphorylase domain-containing protein [Mycena floridula]
MTTESKVLIGVIGGSGLYHLDNLTLVKEVNPETPWGLPSSPLKIFSLPPTVNQTQDVQIAFVARHGTGHTIQPSEVPARANIAALKSLGVQVIVAFSAVGSLREEIAPGAFALPNQIIDRTKGIRPVSFFEKTSIVAHAQFGDPFSEKLLKWLAVHVKKALDSEGRGVQLFTEKTVVCMEGPQFSTRAESLMYRQWGGDLINMSVLPEAKLAREAEISYALICTSTDYDAWRPHSETVTAAEIFKTLKTNAETSRLVAAAVLGDLHDAIGTNSLVLDERGSMKFSIMPRAEKYKPDERQKLEYILPEYFGEEE